MGRSPQSPAGNPGRGFEGVRCARCGSLEIPLAIALGGIVLFFVDKVCLGLLKVVRPGEAETAFKRTIWQTLSLAWSSVSR